MPDVIFIGPPGAGKGTQAAALAQLLREPHVSAGDLLREALAKETPAGRQARSFVEAGELVPDELVAEMLRERFARGDARGGVVLDGFPRSAQQVPLLDRILASLGRKVDAVVLLEIDAEEVVRRLTGRRACAGCKKVFNLHLQPELERRGCDACGGHVFEQRSDDREAVVRKRLQVYEEKTRPLLQEYERRGVLKRVDGRGAPEEARRRLSEALQGVAA